MMFFRRLLINLLGCADKKCRIFFPSVIHIGGFFFQTVPIIMAQSPKGVLPLFLPESGRDCGAGYPGYRVPKGYAQYP